MENKQVNTVRCFLIPELREQLRLEASETATRLSRSVARLTSCELLPCLEYGEEVQFQQELAQRLFYLQHCRNALERCIGGRSATLRYRWPDGSVTRTVFRRSGINQIKVSGLA